MRLSDFLEKNIVHPEIAEHLKAAYGADRELNDAAMSFALRASGSWNELSKHFGDKDPRKQDYNLEQIFFILAHNLRAPLARIVGLSNMLGSVQSLSPAERSRALEGLIASAKTLDDLIVDLGEMLRARNKSGSFWENVDLTEIVSDVQALLTSMIDSERATLRQDLEVTRMFTIRPFIHSILYNLVLNSLRHRRQDADPVIVLRSALKGGDVVLEYTDNGAGIDLRKHQNNLFGIYNPIGSQGGQGLGLYMLKTQVELMGARVSVSSTPGEGTSFTLEFPGAQEKR